MDNDGFPFSDGREPCYALVPVPPRRRRRTYQLPPFLKKAGLILLGMVLCFCSGFAGVLCGIRYTQAKDKSPKSSVIPVIDENAVCIPYIGITFTDTNRNGALITHITPGSPAEGAGLLAGDIITSVNGMLLTDSAELDEIFSQAYIGDIFVFIILRDGMISAVELTVGAAEQTPVPDDDSMLDV